MSNSKDSPADSPTEFDGRTEEYVTRRAPSEIPRHSAQTGGLGRQGVRSAPPGYGSPTFPHPSTRNPS